MSNQYRPKATRHYCKLCNSWMGNDRQSISLHENGAKHKEKVTESLQKTRDDKREKEKAEREMMAVMRDVNKAANLAMEGDGPSPMAHFGGPGGGPEDKAAQEVARSEWADRKRRREEKEKEKEEEEREVSGGAGPDKPPAETDSPGYYEIKGTAYLEGDAFEALLVPDELTVQHYVGGEDDGDWVDGLITEKQTEELRSTDVTHTTYTFAYLASDEDDEETEVGGLTAGKFRIVCGADGAPRTLEEALLILNGERVEVVNEEAAVDENTGYGEWGTVEVRTVTTAQHDRERGEERDEAEKGRRAEEAMRKKEGEERKMEMSKHDNKEDSALGSFNVWGGTGYKGVDITGERVVAGAERAEREEGGSGRAKKAVGFKKRRKK